MRAHRQEAQAYLYDAPGRVFNQTIAEELAKEEDLVFLCGHYEGIDERALELIATDYLSVGDYVLTGGELPAMVMIDCISRLVPGVLNNDASAEEESFHDSLLEYPQYTRPEVFRGMEVPEVLLSGHHKNIEEWRRQQSIKRTLERRPDLLEHAALTMKEVKYLDSLRREKGDLEILEELIDQYVKSLNDEASAGRTKRKAMAAAKKLLAEKACTVGELQGYFKVMGMLAGDGWAGGGGVSGRERNVSPTSRIFPASRSFRSRLRDSPRRNHESRLPVPSRCFPRYPLFFSPLPPPRESFHIDNPPIILYNSLKLST